MTSAKPVLNLNQLNNTDFKIIKVCCLKHLYLITVHRIYHICNICHHISHK